MGIRLALGAAPRNFARPSCAAACRWLAAEPQSASSPRGSSGVSLGIAVAVDIGQPAQQKDTEEH
jgi:hypothetical protein